MTEKRYIGNKYMNCYCQQDENVLVGAKFYAVMNPIGLLLSMFLIVWIMVVNVDVSIKVGVTLILGLPWVIGMYGDYSHAKKTLIEAGHSLVCSQKIARLAALYGGLWSEFKIMKDKDDGKRAWR